MTSKNVTNTTKSPLGLPNGPVVPAGATVRVDDWEKKESNTVVQAWLDAGALKLGDAAAREAAKKMEEESKGGDREVELRSMTNAELAKYIEDNGGDVKSNSTKDELVKQALTLPTE